MANRVRTFGKPGYRQTSTMFVWFDPYAEGDEETMYPAIEEIIKDDGLILWWLIVPTVNLVGLKLIARPIAILKKVQG